MKKNENEKVTITVSSRPGLDSRGWFEEKSNRILEELSFLADTLHRPGDAPAGGWPTKQEEIDFHFTQAVRNALKIVSLSGATEHPFTAEDIDRIIDGGHKGYLEYRASRQS